jgi:CheY-like chemotaxis protein
MFGSDPQKGYDFSKLRVLIVEDNAFMRSLIVSILHTFGIKETKEASDGSDAFEEIRHFSPDLVIVDLNMSPLDGLMFTRLVRTAKDSPNPFIPIVMISGHTERRLVEEARDTGVHEFVAKPVTAKILFSRIIKVIDMPRDFVRTDNYFGPDRRRRDDPAFMGPHRRADDNTAQIMAEG